MDLFFNALIVFALSLLITKSKIFAGKREFVELRYEASKVGDQRPGWIHQIWHAIWTCPMCSGFWFAIIVSLFNLKINIVADTLILFSLNWLFHCLENFLFSLGEFFETITNLPWQETFERLRKMLANVNRKNPH